MTTKFLNGENVVLEYQHSVGASFDGAVKNAKRFTNRGAYRLALNALGVTAINVSTKNGKRSETFSVPVSKQVEKVKSKVSKAIAKASKSAKSAKSKQKKAVSKA